MRFSCTSTPTKFLKAPRRAIRGRGASERHPRKLGVGKKTRRSFAIRFIPHYKKKREREKNGGTFRADDEVKDWGRGRRRPHEGQSSECEVRTSENTELSCVERSLWQRPTPIGLEELCGETITEARAREGAESENLCSGQETRITPPSYIKELEKRHRLQILTHICLKNAYCLVTP